jgi:hypothetical protein
VLAAASQRHPTFNSYTNACVKEGAARLMAMAFFSFYKKLSSIVCLFREKEEEDFMSLYIINQSRHACIFLEGMIFFEKSGVLGRDR